jgi:hypothetical protein
MSAGIAALVVAGVLLGVVRRRSAIAEKTER